MMAYTYTYWLNDINLSDFYRYGLNQDGDFFSLTASESVTIERTGRTYSPEEQQNIFSQGVTAWYITLTVAQFCHIWSCKTRVVSLFKHDILSNKLTFMGVFVGLLLVIFFSYVPGVQTFVGSAKVGWFPWVCALLVGLATLIWNELVKLAVRCTAPGTSNFVTKVLAW
jgi:magnesium-transporting ATPase (P-type)